MWQGAVGLLMWALRGTYAPAGRCTAWYTGQHALYEAYIPRCRFGGLQRSLNVVIGQPQRSTREPRGASVEPHAASVVPRSTSVEPHAASVGPHEASTEPHAAACSLGGAACSLREPRGASRSLAGASYSLIQHRWSLDGPRWSLVQPHAALFEPRAALLEPCWSLGGASVTSMSRFAPSVSATTSAMKQQALSSGGCWLIGFVPGIHPVTNSSQPFSADPCSLGKTAWNAGPAPRRGWCAWQGAP